MNTLAVIWAMSTLHSIYKLDIGEKALYQRKKHKKPLIVWQKETREKNRGSGSG
jgi:hypothetical protein